MPAGHGNHGGDLHDEGVRVQHGQGLHVMQHGVSSGLLHVSAVQPDPQPAVQALCQRVPSRLASIRGYMHGQHRLRRGVGGVYRVLEAIGMLWGQVPIRGVPGEREN